MAQELINALTRALYLVLNIVGEVFSFLIHLAEQGVVFYNHADLVGKFVGILLFLVILWVIRMVVELMARVALPVVLVVFLLILIVAVVDPHTHFVLR